MKKICKIVTIFLIILSLYSITLNVYANNLDIWGMGQEFLNKGSTALNGVDSDNIYKSFSEIIDFLWGVGLLIVFVSTVVLGIKYMLVNPDEKSRIKQATTPYIIGVVIIFGAVTVWKLVIDILEGSLLGG